MITARLYPWGESEAQVRENAKQLALRSGSDLETAIHQIARQYGYESADHANEPIAAIDGLHWRWTGLTRRYIREAQDILADFRAVADLDAHARRPYAVLTDGDTGLCLRNLRNEEVADQDFAFPLPFPLHWEGLAEQMLSSPYAEVHQDALVAYANRHHQAASWRLARRMLETQLERLIQGSPELRPAASRYAACPHFPITLKNTARSPAGFRCWVVSQPDRLLAEISLWGTASSLWLPVWKDWSEDARLHIAQAIRQSAARLHMSLHRLDMEEVLQCLKFRLRDKAKRELPACLWRDQANASPTSGPRWAVISRDPSFSGDQLRIDQHLAAYCHSLADVGDARARADARGATDVRVMTILEAGQMEAATVPQGAISTRIVGPSLPIPVAEPT